MAENILKVKIVSPTRVFFEGKATMVEFNTTEGEIGIYPAHIPTTVILAPGVLTLHMADGNKTAALHAGFAEILPKQLTILAEIVEWPEEIDVARATTAKERATARLSENSEDIDIVRAQSALRKALTRLNVAG